MNSSADSLQTTESVDESVMKGLNKVESSLVKDMQKAMQHNTPTRMAFVVNFVRGTVEDNRIAQTLWIWDR